jgi:HAE1 family hydrophobic/amphiphilic exporter-1/multidrug efflux pump
VGFLLVLLATGLLFWRVPTSFIPSEDQGFLIGSIILPDGASLQRTQKTGEELQKIISATPEIDHAFVNSGRDFIGGANKPNAGDHVHPAQALGGAQPHGAPGCRRHHAPGAGLRRWHGDDLQPARDPRPRQRRRLRVLRAVAAQSDARALGEVVQAFNAALAADPQLQGSTRSSGPTRRSFASR